MSPLLLSLLVALLSGVTHVRSEAQFCLDGGTTTIQSARFVDADALTFYTPSSYIDYCRHLCCTTGGCVAFSRSHSPRADGLFACLLHQSPLLSVEQADNFTADLVNPAQYESQQQAVPSLTIANSRLTDAVELPLTKPWTAANCSVLCLRLPGCIAVEATATSDVELLSCRALRYFTTVEADERYNTSVTLLAHAVPQPTPLDYDYLRQTHGSPMRGWNTYDSYGGVPSEEVILANAKAMATHMLQAGYRLVSMDWGWWFDNHGGVTMDETGRYQPAADRFPSSAGGKGLKPLADTLHGMGLLLGVYEDAGISIYFNNTGERYIPVGEQCVWPGNSYFLDWRNDTAQRWLDTKVQQWADWGVDYVKIDCVGSIASWQNVFMYSTAIARSSRPDMLLSISPGYNGDVKSERVITAYVDEYRVNVDQHDLWDEPVSFYPAIPQAVDSAIQLEGLYPGLPMLPNHLGSDSTQRLTYPDMDILPFGRIYSMPAGGNLTWSAFNHTQQQTAFAIWCFYRSPLLYGGRLTPGDLDMASIDIVTNERLLHVHQNGWRSESVFVEHTWLTVRSGRAELGEQYVLVANINSTQAWEVEVHSAGGEGDKCDYVEAWSGRMESGVTSVNASLSYAQSAVYIISNCQAVKEERTVGVSRPSAPLFVSVSQE